MLLISAIRICHVCRIGYSIICTTCDLVLYNYQEPMRAEGPKECPTAVLSVQLGANTTP